MSLFLYILNNTFSKSFEYFFVLNNGVAAIADPNCTTVVYMPKRTFPALAELLIANDISPQTPALLAESVSTENESLWRSTLAELAEHLKKDPGTAPGLILIGPLSERDGNYVGDSPEVS